MNSSLLVDSNSSLSLIDSRVQPLLSEISSQLQRFFTTPSAPVQLAQIYDITDLAAQQALIKAGSSKQLEFPSIEVLSDEIMGSTRGAYATTGNKIYLNESLLATDNKDLLRKTLLEEIGHSFDPILNPGGDSRGDEGELFQNIVNGNILSPSELKRIQRENDGGMINGVLVEQDNTLGTARNLGNLTGTRNFRDFVGYQDTNDYYSFTLNGNNNVKLTLNNMTANAEIELLNSSGRVINALKSISSTEKAIFATLNTGKYYTRIYSVGGANTNYNLTINAIADNAGNTRDTAQNMGNLTAARNFRDFIGTTDTNDYYSFTLNGNRTFRLGMNGMTANADVQLLNSSGGVITTSTAGGSNPESIVRTLSAGTYYVRAYSVNSGNTNYNLSLNATLIAPPIPPDNAGNTLATARNLGNLAGIRNFTDWVGSQDTNDYYRFSLNSNSNFSIVLNSMTANADLQLLNSSGSVIESSTTGGSTAEAIFGVLNAGTYYVRVYPVGSANTNYNLNFVAFPGGFGEV
jgi:hypothetical protein